ncbi:amidohydrolase family protein [Frigidibacter albus]|uniref:Amidohydrolase family protein n=1 Tax=Frigidibacter albus TaxID=1465486 RepID=A0A6L8VCW4_9RHOB|nr:amidohydrolase family protein [Frigidibacter albus]MZQ87506.1 amidohydrolase family protein [Frigidibacter albus]NBE29412.1 amidohydrolase family protein [Frigidibacter albus]GGH45087.1 2-pyrone-4,6-dicarboxylate hydrolase [Frigidibacter albus]
MSDGPLTWHQHPHRSAVALPAGSTDAHCHVFGPQAIYPYAPTSGFKPADAPKEALFALHDLMGIERCVIVQSGCHGYDNRVVADAIAARPGRYRGVALAPHDTPTAHLKALDAQGFRGLRFNYMSHLAPGADEAALRALAPRLADLGWHLQVHMEDSLIAPMSACLSELPVPVVIDHFGRIDASRGRNQPEFEALLRLLENDHVWCKVSGTERASRQEPPYADAMPFALEIVQTYPDRVLWGTDWPHPNYRAAPPDDGDLFDLLAQIAPTPALLHALMVDNPARLYQFMEVEQ